MCELQAHHKILKISVQLWVTQIGGEILGGIQPGNSLSAPKLQYHSLNPKEQREKLPGNSQGSRGLEKLVGMG